MRKFVRTAPDPATLSPQERRQIDAWWDQWGHVGHSVPSARHGAVTFDEIFADYTGQCEVDGDPPPAEEHVALHLIRLIECGLVSISNP